MTLNKIKYDVFSPICLVIYIKRMKMKKKKIIITFFLFLGIKSILYFNLFLFFLAAKPTILYFNLNKGINF